MTQEEKDLIFKELCARFPYNVKVRGVFLNYNKDKNEILYEECDEVLIFDELRHNPSLKPYLRPLSSMTEEERIEYNIIKCSICPDEPDDYAGFVDWLNAHHFDYRGLIEKGLALPAPEGMYNF